MLQNLHPHYDTKSVAVIQLFGLTVKYKARADHSAPGFVKNPNGDELVMKEEQVLAWTVMPLFEA